MVLVKNLGNEEYEDKWHGNKCENCQNALANRLIHQKGLRMLGKSAKRLVMT
jgi:hypothetical protein